MSSEQGYAPRNGHDIKAVGQASSLAHSLFLLVGKRRLLAAQRAANRVGGIQVGDLDRHHAVLIDNVRLLDERSFLGAHNLD